MGAQKRFKGQFSRASHGRIDKVPDIEARYFGAKPFETVFRHALGCLAPSLPRDPHNVVKRDFTVGFASQFEIDSQRNERTLGVIADDSVRRIRVLLVELGPRVVARLGDTLATAAGAALYSRDGLSQQLEIALCGDQPAPNQ